MPSNFSEDTSKQREALARVAQEASVASRDVIIAYGNFDPIPAAFLNTLVQLRQNDAVLLLAIPACDQKPQCDIAPNALCDLGIFEACAHVSDSELSDLILQINPTKLLTNLSGLPRAIVDAANTAKTSVEKGVGLPDHYVSSLMEVESLYSKPTQEFLKSFRQRHSLEEIHGVLERMKSLRTLVIGETIIDEYQFCQVMSKANKDPILSARFLYGERYAGGIIAIGNHASPFCNNVTVLTQLGSDDSQEQFLRDTFSENTKPNFLCRNNVPTLVKSRFLEEYMNAKLFEVYNHLPDENNTEEEEALDVALQELLPQHDIVIVADYGHGMISERSINTLCEKSNFLAVNVQTNSGNRGFNLVSKYPSADFVSIDEPEARLETRNRLAPMDEVIELTASRVRTPRLIVTQGKEGSICRNDSGVKTHVPALAIKIVDRIGAGDAFLTVAAMAAAVGADDETIVFLGNIAGAEACASVGNKNSICPEHFLQHIESLFE